MQTYKFTQRTKCHCSSHTELFKNTSFHENHESLKTLLEQVFFKPAFEHREFVNKRMAGSLSQLGFIKCQRDRPHYNGTLLLDSMYMRQWNRGVDRDGLCYHLKHISEYLQTHQIFIQGYIQMQNFQLAYRQLIFKGTECYIHLNISVDILLINKTIVLFTNN